MDGPLAAIAARQGGVFLRRQAIACGYAAAEVDRAVRNKVWARIRRGAYVEPALLDGTTEVDRHRQLIHAVVAASRVDLVASGVSAAVLHGLDLWQQDLRRVHVTHPGISSRVERDVHHHDAELLDAEIVEVGGLRATSVDRTAIDVGRESTSLLSGVIALDSALRYARTAPDQLRETSDSCSRWPFARGVSRMVALADGRAATPGETRLRITYGATGLPPCEPQLYVYSLEGELLGIADLAVLPRQTLLEFDGRSKYGIGGLDPHGQVLQEKSREDDLRQVGHEVVRFGWAEAGLVSAVAAKTRAAFDRAAARPAPRALYRMSVVSPRGVAPDGPYLTYAQAVAILAQRAASSALAAPADASLHHRCNGGQVS